jgi:hypothetical protein
MFKDFFCVCQQLIKIDILKFFYEGMIDHIGNMKGKQICGQTFYAHHMFGASVFCLGPRTLNYYLLVS